MKVRLKGEINDRKEKGSEEEYEVGRNEWEMRWRYEGKKIERNEGRVRVKEQGEGTVERAIACRRVNRDRREEKRRARLMYKYRTYGRVEEDRREGGK